MKTGQHITEQRDRRVDLLRGLALILLTLDHLQGNPVRRWTPVAWGLADMAEAFVFMSGMVFGLAMSRGRHNTQRQRCLRALRIFLAYLITGAVILWVVQVAKIGVVAVTLPPHLLSGSWMDRLVSFVILDGRLTHLCVLLLYVWFALALTMIPQSVWRFPVRVCIASMLIYLASQLGKGLSLPYTIQLTTYYNPFAWQFLFITGYAFALWYYGTDIEAKGQRFTLPLVLVVQGFLLMMLGANFEFPVAFISKPSLGFLRYLHAVSGGVLLFLLLPAQFTTTWNQLLKPVYRCSENSLFVYCCGTILAVILSKWMWGSENMLTIISLNLAGVLGCLILGQVAHGFRYWLAKRC